MKLALLTLALTYALYAVAMIVLHPRYLYPFQPDDRVLEGFARVVLAGADGTPVYLQERTGPGPVVLYFMGNAGALPLFESAFHRHIAKDRHIIALEYRGGAGRPGKPSEKVLKADALLAADYALTLKKPLVVQGFSLGTGLATYVSAQRKVAATILIAPYDRLCRLMTASAGLPACWLPLVQKWDAIEAARRITGPILVVHGAQDRLIPPSYSLPFAGLPNAKRRLIGGAGHNDIASFAGYDAAIEDQLGDLRFDHLP